MYDFGLASATGVRPAAPGGPNAPSTRSDPAAVRLEPAAEPLGEQVDDHEAGVVPRAGVRRARVAQADDQPALARRRLSPRQSASPAAGAASAPLRPPARRPRPRHPRPRRPGSGSSSTVGAAGDQDDLVGVGRRAWCPRAACRSPARTTAPTSRPSMSTTISVGMWVASASTETAACTRSTSAPATSPWTGDRHVDGDLLAAADDDQVDVLDGSASPGRAGPTWAASAGRCRRRPRPAAARWRS